MSSARAGRAADEGHSLGGRDMGTETIETVLTAEQVADLARCAKKTIYANADAIPGCFRIGRLVRFNRDAVLNWIGQGRVSGKETDQ